MLPADLGAVSAIAAAVHPGFPERLVVFAERLALSPGGCLIAEADGRAAGYAIAHPWRHRAPPPLDSLLGALPTDADTFYIHDIALMPVLRGTGAGSAIAAILLDRARAVGLPRASLVAVNGSAPFWQRQGFLPVEDAALSAKLASYGTDAAYMARDTFPT